MKANVLVLLGVVVGNSVALAAGCESAGAGRLANRKVEKPEVRTVTHYGMTLDEDASPEEVAFVLLRAIRDDFYAADLASREAAIDMQLDVCAANEMAARTSSTTKA
ncbi:MAG: hypothetical protein KJ749_14655, partial [Planctomycetes bacterium]|nr:hypothetical protein [Planctomycetota bacterium]